MIFKHEISSYIYSSTFTIECLKLKRKRVYQAMTIFKDCFMQKLLCLRVSICKRILKGFEAYDFINSLSDSRCLS